MIDSQHLRLIEALLFASAEPLSEAELAARLPAGVEVGPLLLALEDEYRPRGVNLVERDGKWAMRTAPDLAAALAVPPVVQRKLPRAALETLAIVAYHQPVTRAEIEEIRGVTINQGTLDLLFAAGWVHPQGRKPAPGRPIMWATTDAFLDHFSLKSLDDLPRLEELTAAGLLEPGPALAALEGGGRDAESEDMDEDEDEPGLPFEPEEPAEAERPGPQAVHPAPDVEK